MATKQKLFIPRKGGTLPNLPVTTNDHDTNMRAIEQYVNGLAPGGVEQLIAGTNITLSPTNGEGVVTVSATGGGGGFGSGVDFVEMLAGPDFAATGLHTFFMGPGNTIGPLAGLDSHITIFSNSTGVDVAFTFGSGWLDKAGPGEFINVLPEFAFPAFTGGPIQVTCEIAAGNATMGQYHIWATVPGHFFVSAEDYQFDTTDFHSFGFAGADLTLVGPPSGQENCGIKTAAGGVFWCGIQGVISIPTGTVIS